MVIRTEQRFMHFVLWESYGLITKEKNRINKRVNKMVKKKKEKQIEGNALVSLQSLVCIWFPEHHPRVIQPGVIPEQCHVWPNYPPPNKNKKGKKDGKNLEDR